MAEFSDLWQRVGGITNQRRGIGSGFGGIQEQYGNRLKDVRDAYQSRLDAERIKARSAKTLNTIGAGTGGGGDKYTGQYGRGVDQWADTARLALAYTGYDPNDSALLNSLLRRMMQESGGNPNAVNNWDSNARRGDPTKGLMQHIPSAFQSRLPPELRGRSIFDPFANIVASIRYTQDRYGDLRRGWDRRGGY